MAAESSIGHCCAVVFSRLASLRVIGLEVYAWLSQTRGERRQATVDGSEERP
jgi:hypothetical protein